jgi:hypothetical protein
MYRYIGWNVERKEGSKGEWGMTEYIYVVLLVWINIPVYLRRLLLVLRTTALPLNADCDDFF